MSNQLQITGAAKIRTIQGPVVANSGVITALDGDATQYVRGDGTLADFPTSTGGGSSVSYYLNTSVSQGTIGGVAYKQLSKVPISGAGTDVSISADGYIASYITDANDPALLEVPAGNFNCEFYFSVNSNAHNPYVYAEIYKYDGTTFTLLGSNVAIPEYLSNGTTLSPYYFAVAVASSVLTVTDRIAIRIYVNVDGRTVTLHTENNHLCQVITTFSKGVISLNNLTRQNQFFATGTSGTDFAIVSSVATHTFNIPDASASARGLITTGNQTIAGAKTFSGAIGFSSTTSHTGTATFGVGSNTAIDGADGRIITNKFRLYNTTPATIYSDFTTAATSNRSILVPDASGTLALTSDLSSYVPYTGATTNVNLGIYQIISNGGDFRAQGANNPIGLILSSDYTVISNPKTIYTSYGQSAILGGHEFRSVNGSGTGSITSLYISPSGASTFYYSLTANSIIKSGGTSSQFLKADGSIDSNAYLPLTGGNLTGTTRMDGGGGTSEPISLIFNTGINRLLTPVVRLFGSTSVASNYVELYGSNATANRTIQFPDASGTVALTSNLSSYVPYSGATTNVDLGIYGLTTSSLTVTNDAAFNSNILLKKVGLAVTNINLITQFAASTGVGIGYSDGVGGANFTFPTASISTYTFPASTGTIALTSDLSGYVTLATAQTISGIKTFSTYQQLDNGIKFKDNVVASTIISGYVSVWFNKSATNNFIALASSVTSPVYYTYEFPNAAGTIALTSDIPSLSNYVTLNGAQTISGNKTFSGISLFTGTATFSSSLQASTGILFPNNGTVSNGAGVIGLGGITSGLRVIVNGTGFTSDLVFSSTTNYVYTYPNATGTIALLSGAQTFTSATTFSSTVTNNGLIFSGNASLFNTDSTISLNTNNFLYIVGSASGGVSITSSSSRNNFIAVRESNIIDFWTAGTERLKITSGGFVGINCTANYQFESAANTTNFAAMVRNSSSSTPNGLYVYFDNSSSANTTQAFLRCESTAGVKMVVYTDGNIKIPVGSTYGVFSDAKLKTNVVDVTPKLDDVLKLKVRNFGSLEKPDEKYIGFIAQEFEEVFPSLVTISKDTIKNENGEDEENGEITKGIKESALIPILVKAVQELEARIKQLENK